MDRASSGEQTMKKRIIIAVIDDDDAAADDDDDGDAHSPAHTHTHTIHPSFRTACLLFHTQYLFLWCATVLYVHLYQARTRARASGRARREQSLNRTLQSAPHRTKQIKYRNNNNNKDSITSTSTIALAIFFFFSFTSPLLRYIQSY